MAISVLIVREDFKTIIKKFDDIAVDDDFMYVRHVALEEKCLLVATIDDKGSTLINQLQLQLFKNEIRHLRTREDVNKVLLNRLQEVSADMIDPVHIYIKFVGE